MKAVILAGGHGTRLYPLSTKEKPKQFLALTGDLTLFQETVKRLDFLDPKDIYVATNQKLIHHIKEQASELPEKNIIVEPDMRNTATCIGYAAMQLSKNFPDEVMCIVYADHLVRDRDEFKKKLRVAEKVALSENTLNIIEVEAVSPNPNLGYVRIGPVIEEVEGVKIHKFKEFKEKPDIQTAEKYLKSGNYLWNTGFYVWKISTILDKYRQFLPDTYEKLMQMKKEPSKTDKLYGECESISIDYAIMEKVDPEEVRIIPAVLGWSDIGTFESLYAELEKNGDHERIEKFKKFQAESRKS